MKAFVTGWPIHHSKSPLLHGYWLKQLQIEGSYEALAVEPDDFKKFLTDLPNSGFTGGNVTIPHKEMAFSLVQRKDAAALSIGAVNTLWVEDGKVYASNTDAYGFSANLDDHGRQWRDGKIANVMGAGGASRAVLYALKEAHFSEIRVFNRTLSRAQNLADEFKAPVSAHSLDNLQDHLKDADLLVNTTSLGMEGSDAASLPDLSGMKSSALVTDIVYTPLETHLLKLAKSQGLKTVDGLGMLLHQAVPGFEKWFGIRPEVTSGLRQHILDSL
jgi:shikimate dehydrogenase